MVGRGDQKDNQNLRRRTTETPSRNRSPRSNSRLRGVLGFYGIVAQRPPNVLIASVWQTARVPDGHGVGQVGMLQLA